MLSHVFLGVSDFDRAFAFYEALMKTLGYECRFIEPKRPWAAWQKPGLRPEYHQHYYGAYFRDTEGNKVCVVIHEPDS